MTPSKLVDAIDNLTENLADNFADNTYHIEVGTETYNLIAGLYDQLNRSANALERIAVALEKNNG